MPRGGPPRDHRLCGSVVQLNGVDLTDISTVPTVTRVRQERATALCQMTYLPTTLARARSGEKKGASPMDSGLIIFLVGFAVCFIGCGYAVTRQYTTDFLDDGQRILDAEEKARRG